MWVIRYNARITLCGRDWPPPRGARLRGPGYRTRRTRAPSSSCARQLVPEIDDLVSSIVGADRLRVLKADLEAIRRDVSGR